MTRVVIRLAESAVADFEAARSWYAEQGVPDVFQRLVSEILASIETPAEHPELGRIVPAFDQPFLRELIRPPFRIIYRRDPEQVGVVRIWRSERLLEIPQDGSS